MSQLKVNSIIPVSGVPTGGGGGVVQTVQHVKTDTSSFSISSGGTHDDTNFAASITPTSTSSKILIQIMVNHGTSSNQLGAFNLMCNGSVVDAASGAASGSRARLTGCHHAEETAGTQTIFMSFLHSPASTSQQTYNLRWRHNSSSTRTHYINRSNDDNNASGNGMGPRAISTILLQEVSA
tara:strand:- start:219 stop:761 length:543 start_codon:yes stop_codon:yes gene_type:complete